MRQRNVTIYADIISNVVKSLNPGVISKKLLEKQGFRKKHGTNKRQGFRKKHGTQDSVFILKALIDKYVKSKPKKSNNLLFTCFVDLVKHSIVSPEGNCFKN